MTYRKHFIAGVLLCGASIVLGQTMKVHTESGIKTYVLSEIDSITFDLSALPEVDLERLEKLKIYTNDIPEWVEYSYKKFTSVTINEVFDEIVTDYFTSKGVVAGFEEIMKIGIDKSATLRVVDLQTKEKAKAEFDANYNLNANYMESAGSFPQTKAFVTPNVDKYTGYTYFDNYFIMIHILGDGYTSNDDKAKNAAVLFIEKFNNKFNNL